MMLLALQSRWHRPVRVSWATNRPIAWAAAVRSGPGAGREVPLRSIGLIGYLQLCQEARSAGRQILPQVPATPHPQRQRIVPAVAQLGTEGVLSLPQQIGYVVGTVEDPVAVVGPAGIEHVIADPFTVQVRFVIPQSGNAESGTAYGAIDLESFAEKGGWILQVEVLVLFGIRPAVSDPDSGPVSLFQPGRLPPGRSAPG